MILYITIYVPKARRRNKCDLLPQWRAVHTHMYFNLQCISFCSGLLHIVIENMNHYTYILCTKTCYDARDPRSIHAARHM